MQTPTPADLPYIHVSDLDFTWVEHAYVNDCLKRRRITQGEYAARFEAELVRLTGVDFAVACNTGTAALHLALLAAGVGPGWIVLVPALTYVATANAARYVGAELAFVDVDPVSWTLDSDLANEVANHVHEHTRKPVAILPVHLFDARADLDSLVHWPVVIEDSAHAPSLHPHPRTVATAHSFYASKVIACGEGGAVTTNNPAIDKHLRLLRGQGAPRPGVYDHVLIGYNYRMSDLSASIGLAHIERIKTILALRRAIINRYRDNLRDLDGVALQGGERAAGWLMAVRLLDGVDRDEVAARMHRDGVETRPFFVALPELPMFTHVPYYHRSAARHAVGLGHNGICLPTHTRLTFEDVDRVCASFVRAVHENTTTGGRET